MMNSTNPYWAPQTVYSTGQKSQKKFDGYGFTFVLPHPDINTAGWYFGEEPVPQRHELAFRTDPEYFATDNAIPSSGGLPKYNLHDPIYQFKRSKYVQKV